MFSTCGGVPLAIISVANPFLEQGKINLKVKDCKEVSLGMLLAGEHATRSFKEIRRTTAHCYNSLPDHVHRMCLLSVSMFPKGCRIKKRNLITELVAGGLVLGGRLRVEKESVASACLDVLINQGIVEPAVVAVDFEVKRIPVDGIMQEFLVYKLAYKNFSTLIKDGAVTSNIQRSYPVHRLSIHGSISESESITEGIGLSSMRWLRICSSEVLVDIKSCKLLHVLDLEGCKGIDGAVMKTICHLQFLVYLGLRKTDIDTIPKTVKQLRALETLDTRETKAQVPLQVFELPNIACLFGQFKLPVTFEKSKSSMEHLHCLSWVVVEEDWCGFDQIMLKVGMQIKKTQDLVQMSTSRRQHDIQR